MNFVRKSSLTLISRVGIFVLAFVFAAWIARLLGPEGKGAYAVLTLVPLLVAQFASLGINNANIYLLGQGRAALRPAAENAFTFSIVMGGIVLAAYWLTQRWIDPFLFKGIAPTITAIAALAFPLYFFYLIFNYLALACDDIPAYNLSNLGRQFFLLLGFAVVVPWHTPDLTVAVIIWVAVNAVVAVQCWWLVFRRQRFGLGWHPGLFRETMAFGLKTHLGVVFYLLNWRLDFILCNFYNNVRAVGYYSTAVAVGELLWFVPHTLSVILLPQVTRLSDEESRRLTSQVCRLTLLSCVIAAMVLALVAGPVVRVIFGKDFLPAVPPLLMLLPGIAFYSVANLLTSYVVGRGHYRENNYAMAIAFMANLLANLWWIPRFGIMGAALARTLSYSLATAYLLWSYRRLSGASLFEVVWLQRDDFHLLKELNDRRKKIAAGGRRSRGSNFTV